MYSVCEDVAADASALEYEQMFKCLYYVLRVKSVEINP